MWPHRKTRKAKKLLESELQMAGATSLSGWNFFITSGTPLAHLSVPRVVIAGAAPALPSLPTMDEMLAAVDRYSLSAVERDAAKRAIRKAWGFDG